MSVTFTIAGRGPDPAKGEANFSNTNARAVLTALGYDAEELAGEARGADLVIACDRAVEALLADAKADRGRFGVVSRGAQGCTVIDCGEAPGALLRRIHAVRALAVMAGALGRVVWG